MSTAEAITEPRPMSVAEYERFIDTAEIRYEFDRGHVRAMAGGTPDHGRLIVDLILKLGPAIDSDCELFPADVAIHAADAAFFYPDASIVCGEAEFSDRGRLTNPQIVFEVLSPSTELHDRTRKREAYLAMPSVQAVVLIDSREWRVEIFGRSDDADVMTFRSVHGPDGAFSLPGLDGTIRLADLYRRTTEAVADPWAEEVKEAETAEPAP